MRVDVTRERRSLGATGISVTPLCIGTSPLASMSGLYGYNVNAERAIETIKAGFASSINFMDTSNAYGAEGTAERRIGAAIADVGLPPGFVLATKVDPDPVTGDFSGSRVRASVEESMHRLGVEHIELLHLHDPERVHFTDAIAPGGLVETMVALRDEGLVGHIGVAGGPVAVMQSYLDLGVFEVLLSHNRYTLLDRSAQGLFERAHAAGIGTLNAAPYGGGMLSRGPSVQTRYAYGVRDERIVSAAHSMQAACERYGVPLAAAALQFSLRAKIIDSTVVGVSTPERVAETISLANIQIADSLWKELEQLRPAKEVWLDS